MREGEILFAVILKVDPRIDIKVFVEQMLAKACEYGSAVSFVIKGPGEYNEEICSIDRLSWDEQRKKIGAAVQKMRVKYNITINELAKRLGVVPSIVVKLESGFGPKKPRSLAENLRKLMRVFTEEQTAELRELFVQVFE